MSKDGNETVTGRDQWVLVDAFAAYVESTKRAGKAAQRLGKHMDSLLRKSEEQMDDETMNGQMMGLVGMLVKEHQQVEQAAERVRLVADEHHPAKPSQFNRLREMCHELGIAVPYEKRTMVSRADCIKMMRLLSGTMKAVPSVQTEEE